jgi:hypothetical protein
MRRITNDGFKWLGFDINGREDLTRWDISDPCPVSEKAGVVFLLDVIEHCVNPGMALKHIGDAMEKRGILVLTAPNPRWSGSRAHYLFRGNLSGFTQRDLDENHHVFTPWPHVLRKFLRDAGLEIETYVTLDGVARPFDRPGKLFLPARYILNLLQMFIERLDRSACGMSYGLIARKYTI